MAQNELERGAIDDFYEKYQNKYTRKLEGWQEVIDMYAEQELQKIEEEKQYKEQRYRQQREKERQRIFKCSTVPEKMSLVGAETELKSVDTEVSMTVSVPGVSVPFVTCGTGTHTQPVSSTNIAPTPHIVESQVTSIQHDLTQQREQSRVDAL